jgi:ribosome biogenesis GTPase
MEKRKLNKRQQARIAKGQAQKRARAIEQAQADDASLTNTQTGLLIAHFGQHIDVETNDGSIVHCHARRNLGPIAVGDRVVWSQDEHGNGVIVAVQPRSTQLFRYHKYDGQKLIASNIDQLYIVVATEPPRAMNVLDRYILLAELQDITPIIVFNKTDLLDAAVLATIQASLTYYEKLGYAVHYTSVTKKAGLTALNESLLAHTSIFVGLSGVGKSSLVKALLPDLAIEIGELSERSREGNHTTTTAKLFHLPHQSALIDCPGIRELAMGNITPLQVIRGFVEIARVANHCKFRNCCHENVPGCAIAAAIEAGDINPDRFASLQNIIAELNLLV